MSAEGSDYAARLAAARRVLALLGLDAVLVSHAADVRYLSGFRGDDTSLVLGADVALICTDSRYWAQVHDETSGFELVKTEDLVRDSAAAVAQRWPDGAALGYQAGSISHAAYRQLRRGHRGRLRDVGARVSSLRAVKDAAEIAAVRRACEVIDEALRRVAATGLVGRSEAEVAWQISVELRDLGAEGPSFDTIVAAGAHGAMAHAVPGARRIAAGELVVIDAGARVDGYCSDITRTFAAGDVGDDERLVYDVVLRAQLAGLAAVRPGVEGRTADAAARDVIVAAGYGDEFGHGTGHGVGLEIHESPRLGRRSRDRLAPGMVVTVEPGVYLEGRFGVRIEDTVLVDDAGGVPLTRLPKELQVTT
jgi:Xaa-Pro aminopeptidase